MGTCDITYFPPCWIPCGLQRFSSLFNLHIQGIHSGTWAATPPLFSNSILCCICISNATSVHQAPHPRQIQVSDWESLWICEEETNKKKSTVYMRKPKEMVQGMEELPSSVNPIALKKSGRKNFISFQPRNGKPEAGAGVVVFIFRGVWLSRVEVLHLLYT